MCYYYSHSTEEATETRERYLPWAIELCAQRLDFIFSIWLQNVVFNHSMLLPASFMLFFSSKVWHGADEFIRKL